MQIKGEPERRIGTFRGIPKINLKGGDVLREMGYS
jgi:hypothetical protein